MSELNLSIICLYFSYVAIITSVKRLIMKVVEKRTNRM